MLIGRAAHAAVNVEMARNLEVEFALKSNANPIGAAEYQVKDAWPARLCGKLPTARQLEDAMREAMPGSR